jgi:hypothetical protein
MLVADKSHYEGAPELQLLQPEAEETQSVVARLVQRIAELEKKLFEPEFETSSDAEDWDWWGDSSILAKVWHTIAPLPPQCVPKRHHSAKQNFSKAT